MKNQRIMIAGIIGLTLFGISGCLTPEEKETPPEKVRAVRIQTVRSTDLPVYVASVGRLAPNREVDISAQVPGIIELCNVDIGSRVKADQCLVKLDQTLDQVAVVF